MKYASNQARVKCSYKYHQILQHEHTTTREKYKLVHLVTSTGKVDVSLYFSDVEFPQDVAHQKLLQSVDYSNLFFKNRNGAVLKQCTWL